MFCLEYKAKHSAKHPPTTQAVAVGRLQSFGFPLRPLCASFPLKRKKKPVSNIHQTLLSFLQKARTVRNSLPRTELVLVRGQKTFAYGERLLPFGFALLWCIFGLFNHTKFH
jgi:hypothetical protein